MVSGLRRTRPARKVLIVFCHPVAESLVGSCYERTLAALGQAGNEVRTIDLYAEEFEPVLSVGAWGEHLVPPAARHEWPAALAVHADALRWCDAVVFVYPTWFGGQPAMLKGWFDRVLVTGVAYSLRSGGSRIRPLLRNIKVLLVVTTHGSPKWLNALQGESGKRVILRGFRSLCHPLAHSRWIAFYGNDTCDQRARADFLNRVEAEMLRL